MKHQKQFYLIVACFFSLATYFGQRIETRFGVASITGQSTTVTFEQNFGSLQFNSISSELLFQTDFARLVTGDKKTDSLLKQQGAISFSFQAILENNLQSIVNEENDESYHRVVGLISVITDTYPAEGYVRINNPGVKSDMTRALLDLQLELDLKKIPIPILSNYFTGPLLISVNDGIINQNR